MIADYSAEIKIAIF